eukprot:9490357-Pyramimonas_sp.AAC.1
MHRRALCGASESSHRSCRSICSARGVRGGRTTSEQHERSAVCRATIVSLKVHVAFQTTDGCLAS